MSGLKVFTDVEAYNALAPLYEAWAKAKESAEARSNLKKFMDIKIKLDKTSGKPKEYKGTFFMNVEYNINGQKSYGWFKITEDLPINRGIADPTDAKDTRNKHEGLRLTLEIKRSQAGTLGKFIDMLNQVWLMWVEDLVAAQKLIRGSRKIHELMRYRLSEESDTPNAPIEDPILNLKMERGAFPPSYIHKFLAGNPRVQFFDFTKPAKGATPPYKVAMLDGDVPVTLDNMHQFIKFGSVLKAGSIVHFGSAARSASWISMPINIHRVIIAPKPDTIGFSDEIVESAAELADVEEAKEPAASQASQASPNPKPDAISEALNMIMN